MAYASGNADLGTQKVYVSKTVVVARGEIYGKIDGDRGWSEGRKLTPALSAPPARY